MEKVRVEVEIEDRKDVRVIEVEGKSVEGVMAAVRELAAEHGDGLHIFERDADDVIGVEIIERKALSVMGHRHKKLHVTVRFEHHVAHDEFTPSSTVQKVLTWAVSKKEFNLDPTARAKANLILPGTDEPLAKDDMIGRFVKHPHHEVTFDLTLKDFTNG